MTPKQFQSQLPGNEARFFFTLFLALLCSFALMFHGSAEAAEKKTSQTSAGKKSTSTKKTVNSSGSKSKKTANRSSKKTKKSAARINKERVALINLDNHWETTRELALQSSSALVISQEVANIGKSEGISASNEILFEKNSNTPQPIASITKLMTAMVVLDSIPDLKELITISEEDFDTLRGSHSRLAPGTQITREDALLLALMSSENRAAHALARYHPGGVPAFVGAMNRKAEALGMKNTRFADPTGLSGDNTATARDLARMVDAAYRYPLIREFTTMTEGKLVFENQREIDFRNTNPLVKSESWEIGLSKTGFIQEAGRCLVMQAYIAGKPVIIVLLDAVGKLSRIGDANRIKRWMETTTRTGIARTSDT